VIKQLNYLQPSLIFTPW